MSSYTTAIEQIDTGRTNRTPTQSASVPAMASRPFTSMSPNIVSTAAGERGTLRGACQRRITVAADASARLALIADESGGSAFDEAHTVPWAQLQRRYGDRFPIPAGSFSSTVEYRGQFDVSDELAAADAAGLMVFLAAVGAVRTAASLPQRQLDAVRRPLAGAAEVYARQGGVVTWAQAVGAEVAAGDVLGHVTDPVSRRRMPILVPVSGMLFRCELWRSCLRGQGLAHVAGETIVRSGNLLSD